MAVQGHPRALIWMISVPIESAYATSCYYNLVPFQKYCRFSAKTATPPLFQTKFGGVPHGLDRRRCHRRECESELAMGQVRPWVGLGWVGFFKFCVGCLGLRSGLRIGTVVTYFVFPSDCFRKLFSPGHPFRTNPTYTTNVRERNGHPDGRTDRWTTYDSNTALCTTCIAQ